MVKREDHPHGVVVNILELQGCATANRVELLGRTAKRIYGILHTFFEAYSGENAVLQMGETSSNVVQIRALAEGYVRQDFLVLKRGCDNYVKEELDYRSHIPNVLVPHAWSERMKLKSGDKAVVSVPPGEYSIPAPTLQQH